MVHQGLALKKNEEKIKWLLSTDILRWILFWQGIVHGTTLTVLNAGRLKLGTNDLSGMISSK